LTAFLIAIGVVALAEIGCPSMSKSSGDYAVATTALPSENGTDDG
jgi:hypothetical protein